MHICIVGSGPSSFYTIQSLLKDIPDVKIDIFEKLPAPFGLVRYGVAPDHQKTKNIIKLFDRFLNNENINFFGNVNIGKDLEVNLLSEKYDAVILASGASKDKKLNITGSDLQGFYGSGEFVGWYNGHPDFAHLNPDLSCENAVIIGNGNVALDCARLLAKSEHEFHGSDVTQYSMQTLLQSNIKNIYVIGRRGPSEAKFTIVELREMLSLKNFSPVIDFDKSNIAQFLLSENLDTKTKKNLEILKGFKTELGEKNIIFKFLLTPSEVKGDKSVSEITFFKNTLVDGKIKKTDSSMTIKTGLIISAIGYSTDQIEDLELESNKNFYKNDGGFIKDNIFTTGWASSSSVGVIGTNKAGGTQISKKIADVVKSKKPAIGNFFKERLNKNNKKYISNLDWKKIDNNELKTARPNFVREKMVDIDKIIEILKDNN